ncbi:MAG TPA: protein kinase [Thermoleophilaceae bacterium]|nr:protein kinase [Thermoleophilaceae bacterium]
MSPPTEVAGRYVLGRRLGAGGMSTVFIANDTVLERPVAVKLLAEHLADDEAFVYRFRREALSAARLQHPNIVQVFDSGQDPNTHRHYIVMEYVDGPSAADMLRERKRLELAETVALVRDACHGLDYAHRAGVVHRDVKPGNLLYAEEMAATKLADFGIAKAAEQTRITQVGSVLGTAAYLSPEQARGEEAGPPSDIYSLGVCAYQFLTGRLPHEYASLTELALKQQQDPVDPITDYRPEVPPELDEAVRVALERDPDARYRSALEMAEAIEAGTRGEATEATQRLGMSDLDMTEAIDQTAATRAMQRTTVGPSPTRVHNTVPPAPVEAARARRDERDAARRAANRRRWGTFLALLAAIAAIVIVAVALLSSSGNGGVDSVQRPDVQQQIDGLNDFIQTHTR